LDDTPELAQFAKSLEEACVEVIDIDGVMTKDLALAMKGKDMGRGDWVTTDEYMKKVHVSHSSFACGRLGYAEEAGAIGRETTVEGLDGGLSVGTMSDLAVLGSVNRCGGRAYEKSKIGACCTIVELMHDS